MSHLPWVLLGYGVIVLLGGIMGYVTAKSTASLASSIPSALLIFLAYYLLGSNPAAGLWLALVVGGALACVFAFRYTKTRKAMPAIPMILISDAVVLICAYGLLKLMHHQAH